MGMALADTMESVKEVLGKWGKKLGETAKKTEDLAGNFWQHCEFRDSDEFFFKFLFHPVHLLYYFDFTLRIHELDFPYVLGGCIKYFMSSA